MSVVFCKNAKNNCYIKTAEVRGTPKNAVAFFGDPELSHPPYNTAEFIANYRL